MSKGEGHLISTLDRSISETYMDLYHIDIAEKTRKNKFKLKKL